MVMGYLVIQVRWRTPDVSIQHMHISPERVSYAECGKGDMRTSEPGA